MEYRAISVTAKLLLVNYLHWMLKSSYRPTVRFISASGHHRYMAIDLLKVRSVFELQVFLRS